MAAAVVRVLKAERVRIWWWNNMGSYIKRKRNFFPVLLLLLSFISFLFSFSGIWLFMTTLSSTGSEFENQKVKLTRVQMENLGI